MHKKEKAGKRNRTGILFKAVLVSAGAIRLWQINEELKKGSRIIKPFGYAWSQVTSGSMEPAVHTHDVVMIHEQPDYEVGDIVIYRRPSDQKLIIHRIIRKDPQKGQFVTRGDANSFDDAPISLKDIQGKMVYRTSTGAGLIEKARTSRGFALISLLIALILLLPVHRKPKKRHA